MKFHRRFGCLLFIAIWLFSLLNIQNTSAAPVISPDQTSSSLAGDLPQGVAWVGGHSSGHWHDPNNWVDGTTHLPRAPINGDILVFDDVLNKTPCVNDISSLQLAGIVMTSFGYQITGDGVTLDGSLNMGNVSSSNTLALPITLTALNHSVSVGNLLGTLRLTGVISGAGKMVKVGAGSLSLEGVNTFTGGLQIAEGQATLATTTAAAGSGPLEVTTGATLEIAQSGSLSQDLALSSGGILKTSASPVSIDGSVTLTTSGFVDVPLNEDLYFSGVVQGTGDLTKRGAGKLHLAGSAPNTYAGRVSVELGGLYLSNADHQTAITGVLEVEPGVEPSPPNRVHVTKNDQFSPESQVLLYPRTELYLHGTVQTLRSINGLDAHGATLSLDDPADPIGSLTFLPNGNNSFVNYANVKGRGRIIISGSGNGSQALNYNGSQPSPLFSGPVEVRDAGNFSPAMFYSDGPLVSNGRMASLWYDCRFSTITINTGTLEFSPANWSNGWTSTNALSLTSIATFKASLFYAPAKAVQVNGPVSLGNAVFGQLVYDDETIFIQPGVPTILIENDGVDPVTGTFKDLPDGARLEGLGWYNHKNAGFVIHYDGGDGNDVTLTRLATPVLQLIAPATASYGTEPILTVSLIPGEGQALLDNAPVKIYCDGQLAGIALLNNTNPAATTVQANFKLLRQFTHVGPVSCYADFPHTDTIDSALSTPVTINFSGYRLLMPVIVR